MESSRRALLGQWYTPSPVADLAIALAVGDRVGAAGPIVDPACGDGSFLVRALAAGLDPSRVMGIELDAGAAAAARARAPGVRVDCRDLFDVDPSAEGFTAIVGNPPYVRQERLTSARKRSIRARLERDYPDSPPLLLDRLVGRGDLASAFIARCVRLARPGGRIALVVSSALVDAGYARPLWELIEPFAAVTTLVDSPRERWFPDAAVNAMILVLERGAVPTAVTIARLRGTAAELSSRVRSAADLAEVAEQRPAPARNVARWAVCMRAPATWFELERAAGDALVSLSSLAEVRRGMTSGANDVFYMTRAAASSAGIEPSVCVPLVRSPRELGGSRIAIDPEATQHVAIVCPPDRLARHPGARRYFESRAGVAERPTLRARPVWWALPAHPARLFLTKAYGSRFVQRLSPREVVADQRVYSIHPRPGVDVELLAAILNSTFTALALESLGRSSLGEGALEWTVADAEDLPVLDPRGSDVPAAFAAFRALASRPIRSVGGEAEMADRASLDRAVAPGLAPLLPAIHCALVDSCARRQSRADSARVRPA